MAEQTNKAMSKNEDTKGQSVTVYLSSQIVELVKQEAKQDDRSVSYIVNKILEDHYKKTGRLK